MSGFGHFPAPITSRRFSYRENYTSLLNETLHKILLERGILLFDPSLPLGKVRGNQKFYSQAGDHDSMQSNLVFNGDSKLCSELELASSKGEL